MDEVIGSGATLVAGCAVALGVLVVALGLPPRAGLHVFLDLLLAAGLLALAVADTWAAIATAATVVAVRKVVAWRLQAGSSALPPWIGARRKARQIVQ